MNDVCLYLSSPVKKTIVVVKVYLLKKIAAHFK